VYSLKLKPGYPLLTTEPPATPIDPLSYVSLRDCGTLTHEGEAFRILRPAAPGHWCATRLENDRLTANFQGNPLWPFEVLDAYPNLAGLFGLFPSLSDDACIIPLPETINARLAQLHRTLSEGDDGCPWFRQVQAYDSYDGELITDEDYIDSFIDHTAFPVSREETKDSLHDWSYHFMTLLFPSYFDGLRRTLAWVRTHISDFHGPSHHAWNYFGHTLDDNGYLVGNFRAETIPYRSAIYRQMSITLDSATGKPIQLLMLHKRGRLDRYEGERQAASAFLSGVTDWSVRCILFLEPEDAIIEAPVKCADVPEQDIVDYMVSRLETLEHQASRLVDHRILAARRQAFVECLDQVEARAPQKPAMEAGCISWT
jgi:hypothetical protein